MANLIFDDLIDFPCSPAWLNYYHVRGYTPRFDVAAGFHTMAYVERELEKLKAERARLMAHDEEWFEQQLHKGTIQRALDRKQEEIQSLRNELIALHQEKRQTSNGGEHKGIKED